MSLTNTLSAALAEWDRLKKSPNDLGLPFDQVLTLRAAAMEQLVAAARAVVATAEPRDKPLSDYEPWQEHHQWGQDQEWKWYQSCGCRRCREETARGVAEQQRALNRGASR